jgi:sRNA-binding carbon storage regulator CsrA
VVVHREEIYVKIQEENKKAVQAKKEDLTKISRKLTEKNKEDEP